VKKHKVFPGAVKYKKIKNILLRNISIRFKIIKITNNTESQIYLCGNLNTFLRRKNNADGVYNTLIQISRKIYTQIDAKI